MPYLCVWDQNDIPPRVLRRAAGPGQGSGGYSQGCFAEQGCGGGCASLQVKLLAHSPHSGCHGHVRTRVDAQTTSLCWLLDSPPSCAGQGFGPTGDGYASFCQGGSRGTI
eukprot:6466774-Amphidinium_carterae.1